MGAPNSGPLCRGPHKKIYSCGPIMGSYYRTIRSCFKGGYYQHEKSKGNGVPCLEGHVDLVSRLITSVSHIIAQKIPTMNLLTTPP